MKRISRDIVALAWVFFGFKALLACGLVFVDIKYLFRSGGSAILPSFNDETQVDLICAVVMAVTAIFVALTAHRGLGWRLAVCSVLDVAVLATIAIYTGALWSIGSLPTVPSCWLASLGLVGAGGLGIFVLRSPRA